MTFENQFFLQYQPLKLRTYWLKRETDDYGSFLPSYFIFSNGQHLSVLHTCSFLF